jgi:peroxidase
MGFTRTQYAPGSSPRAQLNAQTGWLDASVVYGTSVASAARVRAFAGGLLMSDPVNGLPSAALRGDCAAAGMAGVGHGVDACSLRIAGDVRANVAPGIFAMQAIFTLEHNCWARKLAAAMPAWVDETLFQEARKRIIAELQAVTYNE